MRNFLLRPDMEGPRSSLRHPRIAVIKFKITKNNGDTNDKSQNNWRNIPIFWITDKFDVQNSMIFCNFVLMLDNKFDKQYGRTWRTRIRRKSRWWYDGRFWLSCQRSRTAGPLRDIHPCSLYVSYSNLQIIIILGKSYNIFLINDMGK